MPVSLLEISNALLPGLYEYRTKLMISEKTFIMGAPHIWVPKLSLPEAALAGAVAAIIENPVVTRRFWSGWLKN